MSFDRIRAVSAIVSPTNIGRVRKLLLSRVLRRSERFGATSRAPNSVQVADLLDIPPSLAHLATFVRLGEIAAISKGPTGIKDAKAGPYPLVVTAEARSSCDHHDFEGEAVLIPMVSSTGHGDASIKRIHYQDGQFAVGSILAVVRPHDQAKFSARFLYEYLSAYKDELLVSRMSGTANVSLTVKKLESVPVPVVPLEEQLHLQELMRLCDALEAKGRLEAEQHARLLSTLLGTMTDSTTPEELAANWQRVAEHFDVLLDRPEAVDALEQTMLQLAVRGLLVPQDPKDEPADFLLQQVQADRHRLFGKSATNVDKSSIPISNDDLRFGLPEGWCWARLSEISNAIVDCPHSTAKFVDAGLLCLDTNSFKDGKLLPKKLRFVSQETFDERVARLRPEPGDLVFAREGSVGESIIIPPGTVCCLGQRVMLFRLSALMSNEFVRLAITTKDFLDALLSLHKGIGAKHVNVGDMRNAVVPVPPFREQQRILFRVTELRRLCADLRQRLIAARTTQEHLADALVESAVT